MIFIGNVLVNLSRSSKLAVVLCVLMWMMFWSVFSGCSSPVKVYHQSADSLCFTIKKQRFVPPASPHLQMGFEYKKGSKERPEIRCILKYKGSEQAWLFPGLEVQAGSQSYFVSTFDRHPAEQKGRNKYLHELSFFIPQQLFDTLVTEESPKLILAENALYVNGKSWLRVQEAMVRHGLLKNAVLKAKNKK